MKHNIEDILEEHKGEFPLKDLPLHHRSRFEESLKQKKVNPQSYRNKIAVVASVVLVFSFAVLTYFYFSSDSNVQDEVWVESYKPDTLKQSEMQIAAQVERKKNDLLLHVKNEVVVVETLQSLKTLEEEYQQMELDLIESGNEKVIEAMHDNLRRRTEILENTQKIIQQKTP